MQVELALAYGCEANQKQILQYIHFNRLHNTMLIQHNNATITKNIDEVKTDNAKQMEELKTEIETLKTTRLNQLKAEMETLHPEKIAELKTEMETLNTDAMDALKTDNAKQIEEMKTEIETLKTTQLSQLKAEMEAILSEKITALKTEMETFNAKQLDELKMDVDMLKAMKAPIVMLRRKDVGNPIDYFDKIFSEYQQGFAANGEFKNQDNLIIIFDESFFFLARAGLVLTASIV